MNNIILRLTEYDNDIKLLKNAILILEKNFSKIKNDIIETYKQENSTPTNNITSNPKGKSNKVKKIKKKTPQIKYTFKNCSVKLSSSVCAFLNDNTNNSNNDSNNGDTILVSELNKKLNTYLIGKELIRNKKVHLNKELKTLLKTKKRIIELDELLSIIIKIN
jgi:hypothetical protein